MLFLGIIVTNAQDWTFVGVDAYDGAHVVLAGLVDADGNKLKYETTSNDQPQLGAFIGGECRATSYVANVGTGADEISYFAMNIRGSESDNGKEITFRLFYKGLEYELNETLIYAHETKANLPLETELFELKFVEPTSYTFPNNLTVDVNKTLDLLPLIKWEPEDANVPSNISWDFANNQEFINVENNVLTGKKPGKDIFLGLTIGRLTIYNSEDGVVNSGASVYVRQPITSLTLKEGYTDEQVVYVGDAETLTAIMNNCYIIEPADANEDLVWSWDVAEDFTENDTEDADANPYTEWTPNTAGHHKLVLTGGSQSITLSVYVMNYLESITAKVNDIHLFVGDNLSTLLPYAYEFTPNQYINDKVIYNIIRDTEGVLSTDENGIITAAKSGNVVLEIESEGIDANELTVKTSININVYPNVTGVNVKNENLAIEYTNAEIDITDKLFGNFSFTPDETYEPGPEEVTSDNPNVCEVIFDYYAIWSAKAKALGSATIVISHSTSHTTLVNGALQTSNVVASSKFLVTVTQGLLGFTCSDVIMGRNQVRTITLTPNPTTAAVDPSKIMVRAIVNENFTHWELAQAAATDETGLQWTITPEAVGDGSIKVYYDEVEFGSANIRICQSYEQKGGWAWVSPYYCDLNSKDSIQSLYGDALHEIRSQYSLLFNDPKYGYFGDLNTMEHAKCYKVYIKDGEYVNNYAAGYKQYSEVGGAYCFLNPKWSWFGNPYQFDHAINEAMPAIEYAEGDRIVSKNDGFAEYNGSEWTGSLTTLKAGEGYLLYLGSENFSQGGYQLKAEAELGKPASQPSNAHALNKHANVWHYDAVQFSDNMSMVADLGEEFADSRYSIGAYINGECRGEGVCVNGKWFITVHGDAASNGQAVNFRVYDSMNGKIYDVDTTQPYSQMAGTLKAPISLKVAGSSTGIESISADSLDPNAKYYTIDGIEVTNPTTGLYIVVDGNKAQKVYIK